jgi:O-antigen/teichoic acid export membrane protein
LYGSDFTNAVIVFQIMVWALPFMFLSEVLGRTCIVMNLEKKVALFIAVNACISIAMSLTLIPAFGAIGAAVALVINRINGVLLSVLIIKPKLLFSGNIIPLLRVVIASMVMGVAVWLVGRFAFFSDLRSLPGLFISVAVGGLVYFVAIFLLKAVTAGEFRFLLDAFKRRF